jgi:lipoprotein-anchoring transpeptidase ErfK/SrfK
LSAGHDSHAHDISRPRGVISGKMPDYYAILWRALRKGHFQSVRWRESVFEQIREMLRDQLRSMQPPMSPADIRYHSEALESAIETIRNEIVQAAATGVETPRPPPNAGRRSETAERADARPAAGAPGSFVTLVSIVAAVVAAAAAAGGYAYFASRQTAAPPPPKITAPSAPPPAKTTAPLAANVPASAPAAKVEAAKQPPASSLKRLKSQHKVALSPDGDLPPGVDGGSTDADVAFVFRRQPVFYRSTHPTGSIIIDKQQHFLYLIEPKQVALRYGIAVGKSCAGIAGLHKVADKKEWPEWQPPPDMIERKLAPAGRMKGGPGNPLGARIIILDDGSLNIHGTNAPATIGSSVEFGCIRLANDDAVDLYNRIAPGARVIVSD